MFKWIKSYKGIIILLFFIIIMPTIPLILSTRYDISNFLDYYSSILTFIGTMTLGIITVYQNYISQRKTDEINKLTIELQKKSMEIAEINYKKEIMKNTPKFEITNSSCNGFCSNLNIKLKNVSETNVYGIDSILFEVFNELGEIIVTSSKEVKINKYSLLLGEYAEINFNNEAIQSKEEKNEYPLNVELSNVRVVWKFKCDTYYNTHYYKAEMFLKYSYDMSDGVWNIEKIG